MKKSSGNIKQSVDAAESNAGDDFHVLWAVRKSLELINFDTDGLKALTVEGLNNDESKIVDPTGGLLLGVDTTEYYGGETMASAKQVIVSQLKYSTRRSNVDWTASRITTDSKGQKEGSVIGRLSTLYQGLVKKFGEKEIADKLSVKLVSNRPVSTLLSETIDKVQASIKSKPKLKTLIELKKGLDASSHQELDTIVSATGLKGISLIAFLKALNFSDCGTQSRLYQKQQIIRAIAKLGSDQSLTEYSKIRELIAGKMTPEQKEFNKITKEDILYEFGISDIDELFPVRAKFNSADNLVLREQLPQITQQILENAQKVICLHAGAGMGKSTIIRQIEHTLPADSVCVLFDCYGNGAYDDPADKRHSHQKALIQICNDLAQKIGTPLLLGVNGSNDYYIREFKKRVIEATEVLYEVNPAAVLAIIIDAADNSVNAASKYGEKSFVHDVVRMDLPSICKLIVSTRTERLQRLNLPDNHLNIPLSSFSLQETDRFLRHRYPDISENEVREFWHFTKATPRLMVNTLSFQGDSLEEKTEILKPDGKTLEEVFGITILNAIKKSGEEEAIKSFLVYLSCLPSPVPVSYLKELTNTSEHLIDDICVDLWAGLKYEHYKVSFRDEDFETYIRRVYEPEQKHYDAVANYLLQKAETDEYASTHLGLYVSKSSRRNELVPIVLERKYLLTPKDPVKNREIFIERTKLAMQLGSAASSEFLKIQMVAAEAAKTDKALTEILIERADLASAYGNVQTNQKIYFQSGNPEWFGSAHYRSAAILSRSEETHDLAERHLLQAKKWKEYREALPLEKRRKFKIDERDLANGAEAVLRVTKDLAECIEWIESWQPKRSLFEVADILVKNLIIDPELCKQVDLQLIQKLRVDIKLLIAKNFIEINQEIPFDVDFILNDFPQLMKVKGTYSIQLLESLISFAEYLFINKYNQSQVSACLELCDIHPPGQAPRFYTLYRDEDNVELDIFFRKQVLLAIIQGPTLELSGLYPGTLTEALQDETLKKKKETTDNKNEFDRIYKHLLPLYQNRAKGIFQMADENELEASVKAFLINLERDYEFSHRESARMQDTHVFMALTLLDIVFYGYPKLLTIINNGFSLKKKKNIRLYRLIAQKLSGSSRFYSQVSQQLDLVDKMVPQCSMPAREQIETYADLAKIGSRISKESGKYYFDKMVTASNDIDLEAHEQIRCLTYIVGEGNIANSKLAFVFARYVEYCWERLQGWDNFPWDQALQGIAKLDMEATFSIICQWDHRNVRAIPDHFIETLLIALQSKYLSPDVAAGLLPVNERYWHELIAVVKEIIHQFDLAGNYKYKNALVKNFIRFLKLRCTSERTTFLLKDFLELIKDGKFLDAEIVEEFKDYCKNVEALLGKKNSSGRTEKGSWKDDLEGKYEIIIGEAFSTSTNLEELIRKAEKEKPNGYVDELLFFRLLQKQVPDSKCIDFLNALVNLDGDTVGYSHYADIVRNALEKWNGFLQIQAWKDEVFENILRKRFLSFYEYDHLVVGAIKDLASVLGVSDEKLASTIRNILPDHLGKLSAEALYQLFYLSALELNKQEKEELIEWTLNLWNQKIKGPLCKTLFAEAYTTRDSHVVIASFLRYQLGHPDKRVRWKALHSLRWLSQFENKKIFEFLLSVQNEKENKPFQNPEYPFYWMSSKLYLWIAIERICLESPQFLAAHAQAFYAELLYEELPHAQIRYFIRSACLALIKYKASLFTHDQTREIETFFDSKLTPQSKKSKPVTGGKQPAHKTRFRFDTMDTLPYWYSSLGRVFGISSQEVAKVADKYIAGHWGYTGEVWKDNHVKDASYELTSNRQGSSPKIENLQTYLEYHGMFCAASDLLNTKPVAKNEDWEETFIRWLDRWSKTWDSFWLSDFRDPLPLEQKYWNKKRNIIEWEWNFGLKDFEVAVGLREAYHPGYLVLRGGMSVYYGADYERQYIASALVHPKTSFSLLRTLQQAYKNEYSIPHEKEEGDDDIPEADQFTLKGWIQYHDTHKEGIDDEDDWFHKIDDGRLSLGTEFSEFLQLTHSEDYRFSFDEDGETISILESWNNVPEDMSRHHDLLVSDGMRLFVRIDALLSFLRQKESTLVLLCELSRRPDKKEYHLDYSYYKQIFLIHGNGTVETLSGNYRIG